MSWYRRIRPTRLRSDRLRAAGKSTGERFRKAPTVRGLAHVFYKTYSRPFHVNGYKVKVCTRTDLAKLFDMPRRTILTWARQGALPEPFIIQDRGSIQVPMYLSSQIRCLMMVIRDLVADGYVAMPWASLDEHLEMLHEGYKGCLVNLRGRIEQDDFGSDKRGVEFIED